MSPDPLPKYVYKILSSPPPEPFPNALPLSALDAQDGFIHLSTATQVPKTADLFFTRSERLWVIKLELSKLSDPLKWENEFPHLYGNFGAADVQSIQEFEREEIQSWAECMAKTTWLA